MMRFGLILLCLVWIAGVSHAQTVQIRSGEHDTFSRLTMNLPSRVDWAIETTQQGANLRFNTAGIALDTSSVFDRIPKDRLTSALWDAESNTLKLNFECACEVEGFWFQDAMLVLDLRDGDRRDGTDNITPDNIRPTAEPTPEFLGARPSQAVSMTLQALPDTPKPATQSDTTTPTGPLVLPEVRDQLIKQVGRAASQGLLTPRMHHVTQSQPDAKKTSPPSQAVPVLQNEPTLQDHMNVTAESSIDRAFMGNLASQQNTLAGTGCIKDARVDVASWGSDAPFHAQIAALRGQLMGEFDKPNTDIALRLARLYVYFGFGAEARGILAFLPKSHPEKVLLDRLSEIVDVGHAVSGPLPTGQLDCPTASALWSALSYDQLPRNAAMNTDAILLAFGGLPVHLRGHLGPGLADRFLRSGKTDVSQKILRIIERNTDAQSAESDLVAADLQRENGEYTKADEILQDVINTNSEPSAEALVQMIDQRFSDEREISYELAQLAGAYAFESQDKDIGPVLDQAYVRALVASGAFSQAFDQLDKIRNRLSDVQTEELHSDLMQRLALDADDLTFLQITLPATGGMADTLEAETSHLVATRLLDLGFADQANALLTPNLRPGHFALRERQLLRARTSLAVSQPRRAIVELLGIDGPDVSLLLADARDMVGEHNAARYLYAAADQPDAAQRQAWLASDWPAAAGQGDPVYSELASLLAPDVTTPTPDQDIGGPVATLARNRELLENSQTMRATFETLLDTKPLPENDRP